MFKNLVVMAELSVKEELSSAIDSLSRLLDCTLPSYCAAGFYLSVMYAYEELLDAQSYIKDLDL